MCIELYARMPVGAVAGAIASMHQITISLIQAPYHRHHHHCIHQKCLQMNELNEDIYFTSLSLLNFPWVDTWGQFRSELSSSFIMIIIYFVQAKLFSTLHNIYIYIYSIEISRAYTTSDKITRGRKHHPENALNKCMLAGANKTFEWVLCTFSCTTSYVLSSGKETLTFLFHIYNSGIWKSPS